MQIHAITWVNPENILTERSQSQRTTYYILLFIRNIQKSKICRDRKYGGCHERELGGGSWGERLRKNSYREWDILFGIIKMF